MVGSGGLSLSDRKRISRLIRETPAEFVVLIGSWARGAQSDDASDIDLLLGVPSISRCRSRERMHILCLSPVEIEQRVHDADDFAIWCLRFGIPLAGRKRWEEVTNLLLPDAPWPSSLKKFRLALRALDYVNELAGMGDTEAAQEELSVALGHLARGLLLERHVFPLSRPELDEQLTEQGLKTAASMLRHTSLRDLGAEEIRAFASKAHELIPHATLTTQRVDAAARRSTPGAPGA